MSHKSAVGIGKVPSKLTILLHDLQELDHDLGRRADQDLTLSTLLSVGNGLENISENRHLGHLKHIMSQIWLDLQS